jgi:hypothetical protein
MLLMHTPCWFVAVMIKSPLDFYRRMVYSGLFLVSNNDMSHFPLVFHEELFWVATAAKAVIKSPEVMRWMTARVTYLPHCTSVYMA